MAKEMLPDPVAGNSAFVDIPGVRLAYDTAGRGAHVVFLHGGLLDRRQWDAQFVFFAGNYRAIPTTCDVQARAKPCRRVSHSLIMKICFISSRL